MPKSTKKFLLSNSKLNSHGFRVLTKGVDLTAFKANPIMYWMHTYPDGTKDGFLPIGYWDDIKIEGDDITAVPVFDDSDPFAMIIYNKVEHGTLRAASVGASPLELGTKADMVEGQTSPTYIRWSLHEASIVDRGSNSSAVTLYDVSKVKKGISAIEDRPIEIFNPEIEAIIKNAVAACKIDQFTATKLLNMAIDEDTVQAIKSIVRKTPIKTEKLKGLHHNEIIRQSALSWDEIMRGAGGVKTLKEHAPEIYKAKFFEKKGYLPADLK